MSENGDSRLLETEAPAAAELSTTSTSLTFETDGRSSQPNSGTARPSGPRIESTDFDLHESEQFMAHVNSMRAYDRKMKGGLRWVLLVTIGFCTAIVGVSIDIAVQHFFQWRHDIQVQVYSEDGAFLCYLSYVLPCLVLAAAAGSLVCFVEPLAAGSGIPEVKCYLNGVHLPRVVDFKTLLAKAPGVMLSVSAGMPCGKEGPMIHSGAIIGGVISKAGAGPLLRPYRADVETRDFVVAGAASGVATAFGAPLGGVLFAMEEGATFFTPIIMLRTFVCCTSATLITRFLLTGIEEHAWGTMGAVAPLSFGYFPQSSWMIWELPIFALMGGIGGLMGAAFNATNTRLTRWRMKYVIKWPVRRFLEVLVVTFTIATIMFVMPVLHSGTANVQAFSPTEQIFRQAGTASIQDLFHHKGHLDSGLLLTFGCIYYSLACWCYGLGLPSGLFVPSLLTGAAFGRLLGQTLSTPLGLYYDNPGTSDPGVYALMGATAMLSGMARITISLAVILMEASGSVQWALPIFVTTMCAKWAGDLFTIGLYDIHIELKHIPLLEANPVKEMLSLKAHDVICQSDKEKLVTFHPEETVQGIVDQLAGCTHNGFPVVESDGQFAGLVKRDTLLQILRRGKPLGVFQTPGEHPHHKPELVPFKDERQSRSLEEICKELDSTDMKKVVNLRPYLNEGCFTVPEHAALTRVYKLFRNMGLRHLPVLNRQGVASGIITRTDLIRHERSS